MSGIHGGGTSGRTIAFTKEEAQKEAERRNSGLEYEICPKCGTTYSSHQDRSMGGIKCPDLAPGGVKTTKDIKG